MTAFPGNADCTKPYHACNKRPHPCKNNKETILKFENNESNLLDFSMTPKDDSESTTVTHLRDSFRVNPFRVEVEELL